MLGSETREASRAALERIRFEGLLSRNQQRVLELIALRPDRTDRELTKLYAEAWGGSDPNIVRPRRFELAKRGLIEPSGKRVCSISGQTATTWRMRVNDPQRVLF